MALVGGQFAAPATASTPRLSPIPRAKTRRSLVRKHSRALRFAHRPVPGGWIATDGPFAVCFPGRARLPIPRKGAARMPSVKLLLWQAGVALAVVLGVKHYERLKEDK